MHLTDQASYWDFRVDQIRNVDKSIRALGTVLAAADSGRSVFPASGQVLLYLDPDSLARSLVPGDRLWFRAPVEQLSPAINPHAFDFAAYMAKKGVYHRAFASGKDWVRTEANTNGGQAHLYRLQQYCLGQLRKYIKGEAAVAIGAALIMGERELISEEVRKAYTDTGSIHVLAVSGLHVGIIYLGFGWLLTLVGLKGRSRRWPRAVLLIVAIWFYALFTGGSASVLRAASMFSLLIIGEALYRRHNIYNTLAASAFLLLCMQPYLLFDVGFQLSYLAVIGIVFFQGRIYRLWYIPNRVGDFFWKLASVSLAAQLTTLPISLFYFHQFPLYFWLSGWVVVPAALVILSLGLGLLLLHHFPWIPDLLGEVLEVVINTMNELIFAIQQLPLALLNGIWLGSGIILLLYVVILNLMRGLHDRRLRPVQAALLGMIVVGIWWNVRIWRAQTQQVITVYHLYGHTAIDIFEGRQVYCLSDLPADDPKLTMAAANNRAYYQARSVASIPIQDTTIQKQHFYYQDRYFRFGRFSGLIVEALPERLPPAPIEIDLLILRNNARLDLHELIRFFSPDLILLDASNYRQRVDRWLEESRQLGIPCRDIGRQGAWLSEIPAEEI